MFRLPTPSQKSRPIFLVFCYVLPLPPPPQKKKELVKFCSKREVNREKTYKPFSGRLPIPNKFHLRDSIQKEISHSEESSRELHVTARWRRLSWPPTKCKFSCKLQRAEILTRTKDKLVILFFWKLNITKTANSFNFFDTSNLPDIFARYIYIYIYFWVLSRMNDAQTEMFEHQLDQKFKLYHWV